MEVQGVRRPPPVLVQQAAYRSEKERKKTRNWNNLRVPLNILVRWLDILGNTDLSLLQGHSQELRDS
jgi:hypothetical protein